MLQVIPGNALAVDKSKQFRPLSKFGGAFLNRFQCSLLRSPVLKCVTMVDTPGILSGEKQRVDRGYDFVGVLRWFAERVDRIILLFDANKLDISDEFRRSIEAIHVRSCLGLQLTDIRTAGLRGQGQDRSQQS